ncbi:MAG: response regulator [Bacteroidota bacterium]
MSGDLRVLVVEDNQEHLRLLQYILRSNNFPGILHIVRDGQEAIDYLFRREAFADASRSPRPDLVLLDLNIPRVEGRQVLRIMKEEGTLRDIPVVVVSSSDRQEDREYAFTMGAAAYISKADGFEKLKHALASLHLHAGRAR